MTTTTAADHRGSRAWRKLRQPFADHQAAGGTLTCWRCGQPITCDQPFDLGHRIDHAIGGTIAHGLAPEHRHPTDHCPGNRTAGGRLGVTLRRRRPSRQW